VSRLQSACGQVFRNRIELRDRPCRSVQAPNGSCGSVKAPKRGASLIAEPFLDPAPEPADRSTLRSSVSWQGQVGVVALPSSGDFPRRA